MLKGRERHINESTHSWRGMTHPSYLLHTIFYSSRTSTPQSYWGSTLVKIQSKLPSKMKVKLIQHLLIYPHWQIIPFCLTVYVRWNLRFEEYYQHRKDKYEETMFWNKYANNRSLNIRDIINSLSKNPNRQGSESKKKDIDFTLKEMSWSPICLRYHQTRYHIWTLLENQCIRAHKKERSCQYKEELV